jgi:hypothetical protein
MTDGTGEAQAEAVFSLTEKWDLVDRVRSMFFDTTPSNTGHANGACVLLQQKLQKNLISLACRHHVLELIEKVFNTLMEAPRGPEVKIFQRFAAAWNSIDKPKFESGRKDLSVTSELEPKKIELIAFIQDQLSRFHPRDDYRKLLELCLLFLGVTPKRGVHIIAPGACHRAR